MYHLHGDHVRAKEMVRDLMKSNLEAAEADITNKGLYYAATIFACLDDDVNALAAWSDYTPILSIADPEITSDAGDEDTPENTGSSSSAGDKSDQDTVAGAEQESSESEDLQITDGAPDATKANDVVASEEGASNAKPTLSGAMNNTCDGRCGVKWTYADDM